MLRFFLTPLFVLLLCTCGRGQHKVPTTEIPGMVDEVHQLIRDKHPVGFREQGVTKLERARTQVQGEVERAVNGRDSIPYHEFVALVAPIQEATQCGHLILEPYRDSLTDVRTRENYFGLLLMPVDSGRLYVLKRGRRTTTDSLAAGTIIASINGTPTATVIDQISPFGGVNDQGNDYAGKALSAIGFSARYQRYFGIQDSLVLQIRDDESELSQRILYPKHRPFVDPKKAVTDIHKTLQFGLTDDGKTGVLTIKSFSAMKFNNGNYYKYIRGVMDSLKTANIEQLVIDIRGNTGGRSGRIIDLFSYLSPDKFRFANRTELTGPTRAEGEESPKDQQRREAGAVSKRERRLQKSLTRQRKPRKAKQHYDGRVAVLVDELTFSASGMFARYVQGSGRGILVGSTAGAASNITFGASKGKEKNLIGPNDDFRLRINSILLELPNPAPGNVTPDYPVTPTLEDIRAGHDVVLEEALRVLGEKKL